MKKFLHFDLVVGYFFIVAILLICQSFTLKATELIWLSKTQSASTPVLLRTNLYQPIFPAHSKSFLQTEPTTQKDSLDFEVKLIKPRKFLLSIYKKQASDIIIKIYDVLGNLVHQEKVSKKGKFRKEYDLSAYKTELYVIEVSDSNTTKAKRLFMG